MITIRILPENVVSQIAAGEVVERPASVVRELVDNSIDAGADRIIIKVETGGKGLVRVGDNGRGMTRDDLLLCIERHATSKIENASDLYSIKTLGFRGEAIPSIASVSKMQITSRPKDQLEGYRLTLSGGKLNAVEEIGVPAGTVVEVRDLFYNLPARRKFLRGPKTEMDHILDTLARAVLPFPMISFQLEDSGKTIMNFPASGQVLPRLSALMGRTTAEAIIEFKEEVQELTVCAYLAPAEMNRSRGDHLFIYVNGRNIRDRLITRAVMEGYGRRLMKGRYPQVAIFLELDPSLVDVNVHPTKQEVRFQNSRDVFNAIVSVIDRALSQSSHPVSVPGFPKTENKITQHMQQDFLFVSEPSVPYFRSLGDRSVSNSSMTDKTPAVREPAQERSSVLKNPEVIGVLGDNYILCETMEGLVMIDQHAAHERVVYEGLKKAIGSSHVEVQTLLIPHELEFSLKEAGIALGKREQLFRMGFELDHFGGNSFLLRSHPAILRDVQWDAFFPEVLAALDEGKPEDEAVLDKLLTVMACHGAVRSGSRMSHEEVDHLIHQLQGTDLPTNCPHGRPVFKYFSYYEIEKMFKRVV